MFTGVQGVQGVVFFSFCVVTGRLRRRARCSGPMPTRPTSRHAVGRAEPLAEQSSSQGLLRQEHQETRRSKESTRRFYGDAQSNISLSYFSYGCSEYTDKELQRRAAEAAAGETWTAGDLESLSHREQTPSGFR
ncbi:hypothetical protein EYF80_000904 [Liparis tanakae]|uniref:Uncharacterized protein n=1 Tax=Liparis tanakae TaxID=230148 RepID=A0A4Z2JFI9_9TELE|nr:hypothetical protein EYF80_000904 [Liparis tanakae]